MPKTKESTVKGFEGSVVFHDPLNIEQVFAIEEAQDKANSLEDIETSAFLTKALKAKDRLDAQVKGEEPKLGDDFVARWSSKTDHLFIPAIVLCVKEWHLANTPEKVTVENFPMSPRLASSQLIDWLWSEILKIYQGETEVPNE